MKIKRHWIVIFCFVVFIIINKYIESKRGQKFKDKIEKLEKERDSLRNKREEYYKILDSLEGEIEISKVKINTLNKKLDSIKSKRNEIPSDVVNMDERELDSILTNYRHPKRN